jgi:acetoin utilization deacetylase AcuC-like enzyme
MERYSLLREYVERLPGIEVVEAPAVTRADLLKAHTPEYVEKVFSGSLDKGELRRLGLPWSPQLVERSRRSCGATLAAARHVLRLGGFSASANLAGGTHHAFADRGEGFCVFNDCVIAARSLSARRIAFVDCDVHQGDGTASLCAGDSQFWTLSLHGANNYPFHKQRSHLDIELPDGCADEQYLQALSAGLESVRRFRPELVFYLAGADPYEGDRLGKLRVTRQGLAARDRAVFDLCKALSTPVVITMAGGYAREIVHTAEIQAETVRIACEYILTQT